MEISAKTEKVKEIRRENEKERKMVVVKMDDREEKIDGDEKKSH